MVSSETLLITIEYVREALDQIIQITPASAVNPLQFLHLIDLHMLISDFSFFQKPRQFALNDLLVSTIHEQYTYQRISHNLSQCEIGTTLSDATKFIVQDVATGNVDLIGWSWLYYHYVEMTLRITQQQFCQTTNLDDRTVRRYQNNAIDQLAKQLIRMEQRARQERRKQILYLELPHKGTISDLIERENELHLVKTSKFKHCLIVGESGIGKTVFVEQVLKQRIDNDEFDRIVWIQSPETIENVRSYLRERLLSDGSKVSLVEYISLKKTIIVIDNAEKLQDNLLQLQDFLQEFSNAGIFLTTRLFHPIPHCLQVDLQELSFASVQILINEMFIQDNTSFEAVEYTRRVWQLVGGNPLAIELLIHNWSRFEFQSAALLTLDQLFAQLFASMTIEQRLAWLILIFIADESLNFDCLSEMKFLDVTFADFVTLGRLCIAKQTRANTSSVSISVSATQYIQMRYKSDSSLQALLDQLVEYINATDSTISNISLTLVESVLSSNWVSLSQNNYLGSVRQFWKQGLRRGHFTKWFVILGRLVNERADRNLDIEIGYGISQRCLGLWSNANLVFAAVAEYAGMNGLFTYQAEALLELAVLVRYQGDYASALAILDHIDAIPSQAANNQQRQSTVERIEIALERNHLDKVKSLIATLPNDEIRKRILQLEILAKDSSNRIEIASLESLSNKLFLDFGYNPSLTARIHVLVGRIYQQISDMKTAIKHLIIAQSLLLEIDNDPFALARTQSNLAAMLMGSDQLIEAYDLLKSAENIQRKIRDRVGLTVTLHNEHVLDRKIVN